MRITSGGKTPYRMYEKLDSHHDPLGLLPQGANHPRRRTSNKQSEKKIRLTIETKTKTKRHIRNQKPNTETRPKEPLNNLNTKPAPINACTSPLNRKPDYHPKTDHEEKKGETPLKKESGGPMREARAGRVAVPVLLTVRGWHPVSTSCPFFFSY